MSTLRPIVASVIGAFLLQACSSAPTKQTLALQPLLRITDSGNQTAASYYQLGKYHQERGQLDLANNAYIHAIELSSQPLEPRNALATILAQQGRLDEAKSMLLQLVADYPAAAHPYNNLGYVYYLQGNFEAATTTLQRALMLDSSSTQAGNNLKLAEAARAAQGELTKILQGLAKAPQGALSDAENVNGTQAVVVTENVLLPPQKQTNIESGTKTAALTSTATSTTARSPNLNLAPSSPQTRMELAQVIPNVYQLKLKSAVAPAIAQQHVAKAPLTPVDPTNLITQTHVDASAGKISGVEVANGIGVTGMAKRIGHLLGQRGIRVDRLSNEVPYTQMTTKIQYRVGYEQTAMLLKNALQGHAVLVLANHLSSRSDVRLVLGKDAATTMALIEKAGTEPRLALNGDAS